MQDLSHAGHQADGQTTTATGSETSATSADANALVVEEVLIEEISIDGMCGVY